MDVRPLDLICLGRVAVDLYGQQYGSRLEDVASFAKYLGGCAGNIAVGCARQGLKVSMLSRVGDEQMGRFLRETLIQEGVDDSHLATDPSRLTALAILAIENQDHFPLLFYRDNCADMAISPDDFDQEYIASSKALLVTGTHFSTPHTDAVSRTAIAYARAAGTRVILDIDYRPVLWGLTAKSRGDIRFVASESVAAHLRSIAGLCDLIVGTEEEFHVAAGESDTLAALRVLRASTAATLVLKRSSAGCVIFDGAIPASIEQGLVVPSVDVEVLNVLGAGDAFMSGFLRGWLRDEPLERCGHYGNVCGALVVSRHGCAPAMPTLQELDNFLERAEQVKRPDLDSWLNHLHRVTTRRRDWPQVMALAFDHRSLFESMADECGVSRDYIPAVKELIAAAVRNVALDHPGSAGMLVDDCYGEHLLANRDGEPELWVARPVEQSGSRPLAFEAGLNVGLDLLHWPQQHVVKCLVLFHPDDPPGLRLQQEEYLLALYHACCETGHELLLEVIPPANSAASADVMARALACIYQLGVYPDWWKLPALDTDGWEAIANVIETRDPHCRGVLVLGQETTFETLEKSFAIAARYPLIKGFAVGRSIFGAPSRAWLKGEINSEEAIRAIEANYRQMIAAWLRSREQNA
jgi:5-dehydro-2-deoxygluconokinase